MNPSYKLQIDVCLRKPVESESIFLRHVRYLPFVPRVGDTIRLTSEATEETDAQTLDISLDSIVYDAAEGVFIADITDDSIVEHYSETKSCNDKEIVANYTQFEFLRLNFPTVQGSR
jgi:hypothetical protein